MIKLLRIFVYVMLRLPVEALLSFAFIFMGIFILCIMNSKWIETGIWEIPKNWSFNIDGEYPFYTTIKTVKQIWRD